ncbi:unnamed protein product [Didymodactylos carnosus]|uniref:Carrier domain-containing protein n=1 Tax=Didymodactylos carnosus TaxID=1234261 RepID=A0A814M3P8_9BILA|nr:unnamed protein product [Didymodactylos carnosus]CAF3839601.1 unnamed protein product [Didymodactylos carnosus]
MTTEYSTLFGDIRPDLIRNETLPNLFDATVQKYYFNTAIMDGERSWTYGQIDEQSNIICNGLLKANIGRGDIVGLWMARGVDVLIAQIGITKSGAAWLPFDAAAPADRISACLSDAGARILLTNKYGSKQISNIDHPIFLYEDIIRDNPRDFEISHNHPYMHDPAYLIYTSGSTGTPKGVVISHSNICHFLRAVNEIYEFSSDDTVFQGSSIAFDLSMEEIWLSYMVGAKLFVANGEVMMDIEHLPNVMQQMGITILDTVPTLLSLLTTDIPSLRMVITGGEPLPAHLINRYAKQKCRLFNSYGPTETTVVGTVAEIRIGEFISIGKPIPNYTCYVVNEQMQIVPMGKQGELLVGGPGVAEGGYLNRLDLTNQKFIVNPFQDSRWPILYRTGDLVSINFDGNLLFHGRIDDQLKIRGFRVEIGEIEAKIQQMPHIIQAVVLLRRDNDIDRLCAFLVVETDADLNLSELRMNLLMILPAYMVPAYYQIIPSLPRLSSDKIDYNSLRTMLLTTAVLENTQDEESFTQTEKTVLAAARRVFPEQLVSLDSDFFTDLGGHSLVVATFVSVVRETASLTDITIRDVYMYRILKTIAAELDVRHEKTSVLKKDLSFKCPSLQRRFLCGFGQALALPFIVFLMMCQWLALYASSVVLIRDTFSIWTEMAILLPLYLVLTISIQILVVGLKWVILGRTKPGCYPLWGSYYYRIWLVQRLLNVANSNHLQSSPLMRIYMRALGAQIGRDVVIAKCEVSAFDLITIGDGASIGNGTNFANVKVVGNQVIVGSIFIGTNASLGSSCVLEPNTVVAAGAELADLTALQSGTVVQPREYWNGSPSRKISMVNEASFPEAPKPNRFIRMAQLVIYIISYCLLLIIDLLPIFPAFSLFYYFDKVINGESKLGVSLLTLLTLGLPTSFMLIILSITVVIVLRWVILPRLRPGFYSIHSWLYIRKWMVGLAVELALDTAYSVHSTVLMRNWYRLMGAKIGKGTEISTEFGTQYDMIELGEHNFIADDSVIADETICRGWMILRPVKTGNRVFIGNSSIVPGGTIIEDDGLLGVQSKTPESLHVLKSESYIGSPPVSLPQRQTSAADYHSTYNPSLYRRTGRIAFECIHMSIPTAILICMGTKTGDMIAKYIQTGNVIGAILVFVLACLVIPVILFLTVVALKWILMGTYKPSSHPLWSWWALRTEAIVVLYGGLANAAFLEHLRGTPFLPWVLRLLGANIGQGVYMDTTEITEFDCVSIGDYAALNMSCGLQTHLYEDRLMKIGEIRIGTGATIGSKTIVLYHTRVGDFAHLGPLTLIMKVGLLNRSTARKEDFVCVAEPIRDSIAQVILRFVNTRWIEIGFMPQRCKSDVENCDRYRRAKLYLTSTMSKIRLQFMLHISRTIFKKFLTWFQQEGALVHMLYDRCSDLLKTVCLSFIKKDVIENKTVDELLNLSFDLHNNDQQNSTVEIGEMARKSLNKLTLEEKKQFFVDVRSFYCKIIKALIRTLPLKNKLLKDLKCIQPSMRNEDESSSCYGSGTPNCRS